MTATEALKFIDEIEWCSLCRINKHCSDEMEQKCEDMRKTVVEALEKQATSDKASDNYEIVHCKECKHWYPDATVCTENVRRCGIANYLVGDKGFCIYGEKVEE